MTRDIDHNEAFIPKYIVGFSRKAFRTVPVEGLHFRAAPQIRIVADAVDGRFVLRKKQLVFRHKDLLCVGHQIQTVGVVAIQMGQQHQIQVGRMNAQRRQLLVDG